MKNSMNLREKFNQLIKSATISTMMISSLVIATPTAQSGVIDRVHEAITTTAGMTIEVVKEQGVEFKDNFLSGIGEVIEGGQCVTDSVRDLDLHETPICIIKNGSDLMAVVVSAYTGTIGDVIVYTHKITSKVFLKNFSKLLNYAEDHTGVFSPIFTVLDFGVDSADKGLKFLMINGVYGRLVILKSGTVGILNDTAELGRDLFHLRIADSLRDIRDLGTGVIRSLWRFATDWRNPMRKVEKRLKVELVQIKANLM